MGKKDWEKTNFICKALERLLYEQKQISGSEFQYVCNPFGTDTIPLILYHSSNCHSPYMATCFAKNKCITSMFFRIEKLDSETCCAVFSLLRPVDMDGCPVEVCDEDFYTLVKTNCCINVDLNCIFAFTHLPPNLASKPLPIIEPKC